ncbi:MAG: hypothetical protein JRH20_18455 [Deltaproteobacteria bacterium]|nr:hypothetical protein [Deltaproteobacteria bacterium]
MRIDAQALPACCQNATLAEAAVVQEMQGATQKMGEAKKDKQAARADKLQEMAQVTKKLREIASKTRTSAWVQLAVDVGSIGLSYAGGEMLEEIPKADRWSPKACLAKGMKATSEVAPKLVSKEFEAQIKDLEAQESVHKARQEKASGMEDIAQDASTEAKRLADASMQRLETMQRIQHEGQLAILRG